MENHDPRIAVTEDSLQRGVRPKPWEAVRLMKLKPSFLLRHPQSMPDSGDPATPGAPAPRASGSYFGPSNSPTRFPEEPPYRTPTEDPVPNERPERKKSTTSP